MKDIELAPRPIHHPRAYDDSGRYYRSPPMGSNPVILLSWIKRARYRTLATHRRSLNPIESKFLRGGDIKVFSASFWRVRQGARPHVFGNPRIWVASLKEDIGAGLRHGVYQLTVLLQSSILLPCSWTGAVYSQAVLQRQRMYCCSRHRHEGHWL